MWFGTRAGGASSGSSLERLVEAAPLDDRPLSLLDLEPTPRSMLGNGPNAARSTKHDFDFPFGSWTVHSKSLRRRLDGSTEWIELDARTHVEPLLDGFGRLDRFSTVRDGTPFEGITLRLSDPATGEWWIRLRLTAETRQAVAARRHLRGQDLQRDLSIELRVLGEIDDAHAAVADLAQDSVVGEGLSGLEWHSVPS